MIKMKSKFKIFFCGVTVGIVYLCRSRMRRPFHPSDAR